MLLVEIRKAQAGEATMLDMDAEAAARLTGPATLDGVAADSDWRAYLSRADGRRREAASWQAAVVDDAAHVGDAGSVGEAGSVGDAGALGGST